MAQIIQDDFYMDDLLTGSDIRQGATQLARQIAGILKMYGFELRKWVANFDLESGQEMRNQEMQLVQNDCKTLGVYWEPKSDTLKYKIQLKSAGRITKRSILSAIAQIFDPLGLINPIIVKAKLIMQNMWQAKLDWDETVPPSVYSAWQTFVDKLPFINDIKIGR
ncbi:uncharacterized protein [Prorops nasuta]|uniref:uncharacterized protein n=1 Tax=Prorops nasuta TaxID=863751 RepID=UPI0034CFBB9E